jgi:hypothetical protein
VERPRDPFELVIGFWEELTKLRTIVGHMQADIVELKQDCRRLDDRFFQMMLLQVGTLAAALASLVAAVLR